ncbi:MAG: sigma-54-dependent Fis family transcriptional regulator [Devosia sp. 67-54]|uniref:sigma-54-dependent transcriptional regulator n=1 Tax=unclassified Devosia TaxID=196773 RepID=UPI00095EFDB2|nr:MULTISPECIES: sigma-54 dependent transcriptional regulator [unclassified Devosia]MBN9306057.1 sigma-54-dependent Fis family transcriptional regulator [Devosia sp.]OJX16270.1 MAG: sigma-54-dependent Fis family transcriptional regulator [Devosia sp. 67-54]
MARVLIVDDDPVQLRLTAEVARRAGFTPVTAAGGDEALSLLRADPGFGAMILDLVMPERDGMAVLDALQRDNLNVPVIVQTAHSSLETVVSAMRNGAVDFFVKPVAPERLIVSLRNVMKLGELETIVRTDRNRRAGLLGLGDIVTRAPAMDRVLTLVQKAAKSPIPVLIEGETGTGKELIARVIQGMGDRATKPFVTVNCGAIPANLVESTLFGHKKGAFTGAVADHAGKFSEANGGTLFLDEIGELPPDAQAKLLRALQEGEIEPVGASRIERVNVRVISATNRRLLNLAQAGAFREDLYYRLNVFPVYLPPLRERREDIELLAGHFIARFAAEAGKRIAGLSGPALALLQGYDWPGNIRQLENTLYRAIVLSDGGYLEIADFPQIVAQARGREESLKLTTSLTLPSAPVHIDAARPVASKVETREAVPDRFLDAKGEVLPLETLERELIEFALKRYGGRMSKVARALGIGRSTLYRKLRDYGLEGDFSDAA